MITTKSLFDLSHTLAKPLLESTVHPWKVLPSIGSFIKDLGAKLPEKDYYHPSELVWIAKSAKVAPTASITGPCIIGPETEVRHCAFIRGNALVGSEAVVGNSTELKNVILFDKVEVPHFNYVGDSILGYRSHMGAGSITSNVKSDKSNVVVKDGDKKYDTGFMKFGAILGDLVEVGCNSVLNPGSVIGKGTSIYPLSCVRGVIPPGSIYKKQGEVIKRN